MEKRSLKRIPNGSNYSAEIGSHDQFSIKSISTDGVCLEIPGQLPSSGTYEVTLNLPDNIKIKAHAEVVWSEMSKVMMNKGKPIHVYDTALKFTEMNSSNKDSIEKLISSIDEKNKTILNRFFNFFNRE